MRVINPYWTIPPTILFNDVLPAVQKDPTYLKSKNIRVFPANGNFDVEIDPLVVDWKSLNEQKFPYVLRQDPGPGNALGIVKFMFPNKYNVYLHDTPSRELFTRTDRAFSSGCIRVNNPLSFVDYLISDDMNWDTDKVMQTVSLKKNETISLKNPLNVHILYMTSWSEDDIIHFRNDIYGRDQIVLDALKEKAPSVP